MEYLLFVVYLVFFTWLVTKVKFFNRSGLSNSQIIIVFLLKVMAGIFYGWIGLYYGTLAQMVDTWEFHRVGLQEYQLMRTNPSEYLTNLFYNPYRDGLTNFFAANDSYWNDLKSNFIIKLISVFNIFSFGQYYINVIFFSFITMFGPVAIYRVMNDVFPGKKIQVLLATFLVPSFLYWSSGIHKEGLIFLAFSLVIYQIYFGLKERKLRLKRVLFVILGLLLVLILRNFLIVILVPALITWLIAERFSKRSLLVFGISYAVFVLLFFTGKYLHPNLDFPQAVVSKQQEFLQLQGGYSAVPINILKPSAGSFLSNAPQALTLSAIRPYPSDVRHILSLAAASEINLLLLLFLVFLFFHTNGIRSRTFIYFCLFLSFSVLLTIGYTVNFLGAIVRYRSIVLPFLVVPMVCLIDWRKIGSWVFPNIINKNNVYDS